jgi:hypothetical protein
VFWANLDDQYKVMIPKQKVCFFSSLKKRNYKFQEEKKNKQQKTE